MKIQRAGLSGSANKEPSAKPGERTGRQAAPASSGKKVAQKPSSGKESPKAKGTSVKVNTPAKGNQKQKLTAEQFARRKRNKIIKIVIIVVAVLTVVGIGAKLGYDYYVQKQYEEKVDTIAAGATDILNEVITVLNSKAPTTWVYDRDENLIMTLKVSSSMQAVDTVPEELQQVILAKADGDMYAQVVNEYLLKKSIPVVEGTFDGYKKCLSSQANSSDLSRYLATSSTYGGLYVGAVDAANNYFGLTLSQMNPAQLSFLAASYREDNFDIDTYLEQNNTNEERLGLIIHRSDYSAVRAKILDELSSLEGIDVDAQSYMVKLSTSTQQQSILQTAIDQGMRQLIDLNGDGTYAFDCSVVVADRNSGYIRVYVPGRTTSAENAKPFMMNTLNFRDSFASLYQQLLDVNTFGFTLREVTKSNGDKELRSIEDLFINGLLSEPKSIDLVDPIGMLRSMYSASSKFGGTTMIYQVTDSNGATLYKAPGDSILDLDNNNLAQFFANEENDLTFFGTEYNLDTGVVSFLSTADYTLVILAGSGAVGGSVTTAQRELMLATIDTIKGAVADFYPTPVNPVWNGAGMDAAMTVCYAENQRFVEGTFIKELDELVSIEVNSFASRVEFENKYESIRTMVKDYEVFIGKVFADSLRDKLEEVRLERAELLIKFSV